MPRKVQFKNSVLEIVKEKEEKYGRYIVDVISKEKDALNELEVYTNSGLNGLPSALKNISVSNVLDIGDAKSVKYFLKAHFEDFVDMENDCPILGLQYQHIGKNIITDKEPTIEEFHHLFYKQAKEAVQKRFKLSIEAAERDCKAEKRNYMKLVDIIESKRKGRKIVRATFELKIKVIAGPHAGDEHAYSLNTDTTCIIGRNEASSGQKEHAISLPLDETVSSFHGLIEVKMNENMEEKLYFIDCHSSNGSDINGKSVEPNQPVEIESPSELYIGDTKLEVSFESIIFVEKN